MLADLYFIYSHLFYMNKILIQPSNFLTVEDKSTMPRVE